MKTPRTEAVVRAAVGPMREYAIIEHAQTLERELITIAEDWRRDAKLHRSSCRWHEKTGRTGKADIHNQRALDLDACAKRIEDLVNEKGQQ